MSIQDAARSGMFLERQINDRQVSELVGIARGLVADGELNDSEIEFLHRWLVASGSGRQHPMVGLLLERIRDIYADGWVDETERSDLTDLLVQLSGNDFEIGEALKSTTLPLCDPAPNLEFEGKKFCMTGTFTYGKRSSCEAIVTGFGGTCTSSVSKSTDYLVIGEYATGAWSQSSFGRKIEQAVQLRADGAPIFIVAEHHWRNYI
jgi:NAD-dependent DNA ligase